MIFLLPRQLLLSLLRLFSLPNLSTLPASRLSLWIFLSSLILWGPFLICIPNLPSQQSWQFLPSSYSDQNHGVILATSKAIFTPGKLFFTLPSKHIQKLTIPHSIYCFYPDLSCSHFLSDYWNNLLTGLPASTLLHETCTFPLSLWIPSYLSSKLTLLYTTKLNFPITHQAFSSLSICFVSLFLKSYPR